MVYGEAWKRCVVLKMTEGRGRDVCIPKNVVVFVSGEDEPSEEDEVSSLRGRRGAQVVLSHLCDPPQRRERQWSEHCL